MSRNTARMPYPASVHQALATHRRRFLAFSRGFRLVAYHWTANEAARSALLNGEEEPLILCQQHGEPVIIGPTPGWLRR